MAVSATYRHWAGRAASYPRWTVNDIYAGCVKASGMQAEKRALQQRQWPLAASSERNRNCAAKEAEESRTLSL